MRVIDEAAILEIHNARYPPTMNESPRQRRDAVCCAFRAKPLGGRPGRMIVCSLAMEKSQLFP